jgi:hypothetical protein
MNLKEYINFYSIEQLIKKKKFIPMKKFSSEWSGTDTKELYETNLAIQPAEWYYRNNPVRYELNSDGYRTQEFKKIDWSESVVIFGCSMVFGIGIDEADTIGNQLSTLIGRPVINMGVGGSSITVALHNSLILNKFYSSPKAVIHLWTDYDRCTYYESSKVIHYGSWNAEEGNLMDNWNLHESNSRVRAIFDNMAAKQIWEGKTEFIEASFFKRPAKLFGCPHVRGHYSKKDYARDLVHPGREATKQAAIKLASMLKL